LAAAEDPKRTSRIVVDEEDVGEAEGDQEEKFAPDNDSEYEFLIACEDGSDAPRKESPSEILGEQSQERPESSRDPGIELFEDDLSPEASFEINLAEVKETGHDMAHAAKAAATPMLPAANPPLPVSMQTQSFSSSTTAKKSAKPWFPAALGSSCGIIACLVLWTFGFEPPAGLRLHGAGLIHDGMLQQAQPASFSQNEHAESSSPGTGELGSDGQSPRRDAEALLQFDADRLIGPLANILVDLHAGPLEVEALAVADNANRSQEEKRAAEAQTAELKQALRSAREASQQANAAVATSNALARDLHIARAKLKAAEIKLQDMEAQRRASYPYDSLNGTAGVHARQPERAYARYTNGLHLYQDGKFPEAEKEFCAAVKLDDQDARYHYFLGLVRVELNMRDQAVEGFQRGVRLEEEHMPSRVFVALALESARKDGLEVLNRFRK